MGAVLLLEAPLSHQFVQLDSGLVGNVQGLDDVVLRVQEDHGGALAWYLFELGVVVFGFQVFEDELLDLKRGQGLTLRPKSKHYIAFTLPLEAYSIVILHRIRP